jgi:hypothetical protein
VEVFAPEQKAKRSDTKMRGRETVDVLSTAGRRLCGGEFACGVIRHTGAVRFDPCTGKAFWFRVPRPVPRPELLRVSTRGGGRPKAAYRFECQGAARDYAESLH